MPGTDLEIIVGGRWLSLDCRYGDVEMSTCWPGGSDELSWAPGSVSPFRFRGGELTEARYGGVPVFAGKLVEPDPSQDRMVAQGAWREADDYVALTSAGITSKIPDEAVDQAIARGLQWTRPASLQSSSVIVDLTTGPIKVGALLDLWATSNTLRWGVNPRREVYGQTDPGPIYQTLPMEGGNGFAMDNYASTLVVRYLDSTTSAYTTVTVTDANADTDHGHVEDILDLTDRGAITAARATNVGTSVLALYKATPQWTAPLQLAYGDILNTAAVPVALETVAAGQTVRVMGGWELAQRLNGAMYVDMLIGATSLAGGLLTVRPIQLAPRDLLTVLGELFKGK